MSYAAKTKTSVESSRAEIEKLVIRAGAKKFGSGWDGTAARVEFELAGRHVRLVLPLPDAEAKVYWYDRYRSKRTPEAARRLWEQDCRAKWRALVLIVKAKLEAVTAGISTIEREFLADVVVPGGGTVADELLPALAEAYTSGRRLLTAPGAT